MATIFNITGTAVGAVGFPSQSITFTPDTGVGTVNVILVPNDGGKGGSFYPQVLQFASGTGTGLSTVYTPAAGGTITISCTNNGGAANGTLAFTAKRLFLIHDTTFTGGPVASVAAGATLQDGWIDLRGSNYDISASNYVELLLNTAPYAAGLLARPTSEDTIDGQITVRTYANTPPGAITYLAARHNRSTASPTCYFAELNPAGPFITISKVVAGVTTNISNTTVGAITAGTTYDFTFSWIQINGTTTQLNVVQASTAGVVLKLVSVNDTTSSLQNLSGSIGIFGSGSTSLNMVSRARTYTNTIRTATAYTITGPATGYTSNPSNVFTIQPNGAPASAVNFTLSDGSTGTFSPSPAVLASGSSEPITFTYNAAVDGAYTLTPTNSGGLTNPAALAYTSSTVVLIPVTSTAMKTSPYNWRGPSSRALGPISQCFVAGAYQKYYWTATASPVCNIIFTNPNNNSGFRYICNGYISGVFTPSGVIPVTTSLMNPNAANILEIVQIGGDANTGYSGFVGSGPFITSVAGIQLEAGATPTTAPVGTKRALIIGDSITDGFFSNTGGAGENMYSYAFMLRKMLELYGYEMGSSSHGGSGWIVGGASDLAVPPYYYVTGGGTYIDSNSRWNKFDNLYSLLDSNGQISAFGATGTSPDLIMINYGENDHSYSAATMRLSITQCMTALRGAAPNAYIVLIMPFNFQCSVAPVSISSAFPVAMIGAVSDYQTANPSDSKVGLINLGFEFSQMTGLGTGVYTADNVHLLPGGAGAGATMIAAKLRDIMNPAAFPAYAGGFHP